MEEFKRLMYLIFLWNAIHTVEGFDNLSSLPAYKGHASQSRTYGGYNAPADRAVDGYLQEERENTCSITWANPEVKVAWWKFSLKRMSNIAYLEIYFRSSTVNRHVGFSVFVFNNSSYIPPSSKSRHEVFTHNISTCPDRVSTITINKEIQGIALYNSKDPPVSTTCAGYEPTFATIEICEVKIMGCPSQHYGENCTSCDPKCRYRQCDAFNGACIYGCSGTVIEAPDCSECIDGYYGEDCMQKCGFCKNGTVCNKTSGICPEGCQGNWNHLRCTDCESGFYGPTCENFCGNCRNGTYCNTSSGVCPDSCDDHWDGLMCNDCEEGFYGQTCENFCGHCRNGTYCNTSSGVCPDSCEDHWDGQMCNVCKKGYYGQSCELNCGKCSIGTFCDTITGICPDGCQDYYASPLCNTCKVGFYGHSCEKPCGNCRNGTYCNSSTGVCPNGCENHWVGEICKDCEEGFYGPTCENFCGNCRNGTYCNTSSGVCPDSCDDHWDGLMCNVCKEGYYGHRCELNCGKCSTGTFCDTITGICPEGCQDIWAAPLCDTCEVGFYGQTCEKPCGSCRTGTYCNTSTGICPNGCENHWVGVMCKDCEAGFFGQTCEYSCGNCRNGTYCNMSSGICPDGCEDHWDGQMCNECKNGYYGLICEGMCGNCGNGTYCNKENGTCPAECQAHWNGSKCDACEDGYFGLNCDRECTNCIANNCYQDNGTCSKGCKERWTGAECDTILLSTEPNTGAIVGGLMTVFILLAFVVIIVIAVLRRQYAEKDRENTGNVFRCVEYDPKINPRRKKYANIVAPDISLQSAFSNAEYYNLGHISTVMRTQDLQDIIAFKGSEKQHPFIMEYKRLPPGDVSKCPTAQKKENITKNRFKTTFPYEHSRVVLGEKWDVDDNDYINANYIKDFKGERRYIAAQGPRENTLTDFLKMIWQENIQCIVMLTNLVEDGKKKCAKYWPDNDMSKNIGQCTLSLLEETVYAFYTFRMFSLQRRNLHDLRIITHFHYTAWPDHDTPEEIALVQFHRTVTKKWKSESPLLVHCSAGVGRTGTFIGLDTLLKQGRQTGRINIFEFVKQMREDRMTMVQTVEQYVFLHKALLCGFQERETVISELNLEPKLNLLHNDTSPLNQQQLYKEFKFLETMIPVYEMECKEDALSSANRSKNVYMGILPVSKYRPFLASNAKGRNEYINAVIVPSFTHPAGFILTQKPLPDTEIDLWRLCMDYQVGEMVVLNGFDEDNQWLPARGGNRSCPPYVITVRRTGMNIYGVDQCSLLVLRDGKTQSMDVFQIYSKNDDEVIKVVEMLLEKEKESTMTSLVISKNGAGATGLFCVLHNALQQLRMDGEVDIFTIVRQLQTRRPEVINKLEEYRKCYQLVSRSVSTSGTYANM